MTLNIPYRIRAGLYVFTALSAPVVAYLLAKGIIGEIELGLYGGLITAVNSMAALNTGPKEEEL